LGSLLPAAGCTPRPPEEEPFEDVKDAAEELPDPFDVVFVLAGILAEG